MLATTWCVCVGLRVLPIVAEDLKRPVSGILLHCAGHTQFALVSCTPCMHHSITQKLARLYSSWLNPQCSSLAVQPGRRRGHLPKRPHCRGQHHRLAAQDHSGRAVARDPRHAVRLMHTLVSSGMAPGHTVGWPCELAGGEAGTAVDMCAELRSRQAVVGHGRIIFCLRV